MSIYFGQDVAEKLSQADDYYSADNHINHCDWSDYTDDERKAGLSQAEREINMYLGIDLEYNYRETDWPYDYYPNYRPDYAVFEHALFVLQNTVRKNTSKDGVISIETDQYQREEATTGVAMSPQAQRYLKVPMNRIMRG